MPAAVPPAFALVLLGASKFPKFKDFAAKQERPFSGAHKRILKYFQESLRLGEDHIKDLFDSKLEPAKQLEAIESFIAGHAEVERIVLYYVGHGLDHTTNTSLAYTLACAATRDSAPLRSSIDLQQLAEALNVVAKNKDLVLILDCCFAAQAASRLQGVCRNIAFLAASSSRNVAIAPPEADHTQFADCLYEALTQGAADRGPALSLTDLRELVTKKVKERYSEDGVYPETHAPTQSRENLLHTPLFPNPAYSGKQTTEDEREAPYLLVQVEPELRKTPRPRYRVKAWVMTGLDADGKPTGDLVWDTETDGDDKDKFLSKDQLGPLLLLLKNSAADVLQRKGILKTDFWIELLLPRELLSERFDQQPVAFGTLGMEHPVMVRSLERLRGVQGAERTADGRLRIKMPKNPGPSASGTAGAFDPGVTQKQQKRWLQLRKQAHKLCPPLIELHLAALPASAETALGAWVSDQCTTGPLLWDRLMNSPGDSLVCAVLEKAPAEVSQSPQGDTFHALLLAGIPVMLWSRDPQAQSAQPLRELMTQTPWGDLPQRVRTARRTAATQTAPHFGRELTLLWDDPERGPPPVVRLLAPPLRNRNAHG